MSNKPARPASYDRFADRYDSLSPGVAGDVVFYCRLAAGAESPVLELGCGTGRVAVAIAAAGVSVVGLDSSEQMLAIARAKTGAADNPRWLQADMRDFDLPDRFGLIIVPYRGFQHLLTRDDQATVLARIFGHLLPGGRLALDLFNDAAIERLARVLHAAPLRRKSSRSWPPLVSIDAERMQQLLREAGFEIEAVYGDFERRPFDSLSPIAVWMARRPPAVSCETA